MADPSMEARRRRRSAWPVRRIGREEDRADLSGLCTPAERLAMMWPLAVEAWTVAGLPLPRYTRKRMPARLIRRESPGK